jgi:hypothetical protein
MVVFCPRAVPATVSIKAAVSPQSINLLVFLCIEMLPFLKCHISVGPGAHRTISPTRKCAIVAPGYRCRCAGIVSRAWSPHGGCEVRSAESKQVQGQLW